MPVECVRCGLQGDTVHYRRPETKPKQLKWLKGLILLAGFFSFTSVFQLVDVVVPLIAAAAQLHAHIMANPAPGQEALQDYVQIYTRAVLIFALALVITLGTIVLRYLAFFVRGFRSGHPRTLVQVRAIAWLQMSVQGLSWLTVAVLFTGLKTIQVTPTLGAGFFIAPVLLWYTRRPALRTFFSAHNVEPVPKAPKGGTGPAAWEPVTPI